MRQEASDLIGTRGWDTGSRQPPGKMRRRVPLSLVATTPTPPGLICPGGIPGAFGQDSEQLWGSISSKAYVTMRRGLRAEAGSCSPPGTARPEVPVACNTRSRARGRHPWAAPVG